jgi:hypothetical protein
MTNQEIYENTAFGRYSRSFDADDELQDAIHSLMADDIKMRELTRIALENGDYGEFVMEIMADIVSLGLTDNVKKLRLELAYKIASKECGEK